MSLVMEATEWLRGTWTKDGIPQVVVLSLSYFVLVAVLICIMELFPTWKPQTKYANAVHNLAMSVLSAWMFWGCGTQVWENWNSFDHNRSVVGRESAVWCDSEIRLLRGTEVYFYWFFLSKFLEYIDSVFLILNRKYSFSVGFALQVYHHSTTASIAWVAWFTTIPCGFLGVMTNSFVHIVMYFYFAAVTFDKRLKKIGHFVTYLQLIQFYFVVGTGFYNVYLIFSGDCGCDRGGAVYIFLMYCSYMVFFLVFHQARSSRMKRLAKNEATDRTKKGFVPPCVQTAPLESKKDM